MQNEISNAFRDGTLTPSSTINEVKWIGTYLYKGLIHEFAPTNNRLSIRGFCGKIRNLADDALKFRLKQSVKNNRANKCIQNYKNEGYHVQEINNKGWEALISLIKVIVKGNSGYDFGSFNFNYRVLKLPPKRESDTKKLGCLSRRECRINGGIYSDGLCQTRNMNHHGFEGIDSSRGQKKRSRVPVLGYAQSPIDSQIYWKKPN